VSAPLSVAARRPGTGHARGRRLVVGALVVALVLLLGAGWLLWDNRRLVVTGHEVQVASAPEGRGLRIAQVSDLHAADHGSFQDRIVAEIEQRDVDLIAITGDLIDVRTTDLGPVLDLAARLDEIAPTFFVLGNHEGHSSLREELLDGLADAGVTILRDEARTLEVSGRQVVVAGLDDPIVAVADGGTSEDPGTVLDRLDLTGPGAGRRGLDDPGAAGPDGTAPDGPAGGGAESGAPEPDDAESDEAGQGDPVRGPTVLLAHRPELLAQYSGHGADLVLSGHAHGGQVRLPLIGPLFAPHQGWFPELTEGVHVEGETAMVISRGLGNSVAGVRVNDPRELVIVDLVQRGTAD